MAHIKCDLAICVVDDDGPSMGKFETPLTVVLASMTHRSVDLEAEDYGYGFLPPFSCLACGDNEDMGTSESSCFL